MKNIKLIALLGLGFMTIQSCSKQSELCECTDMATEMMKGDRENGFDGTFQKKYLEEHKAEKEKCEKIYKGKNEADMKKAQKEMKECSGYGDYKDEMIKNLENFKKKVPSMADEIDKTIQEL